jgi:hypothetical protein
MGKGRNKRHRKRRQQQSKKAKRQNKKQVSERKKFRPIKNKRKKNKAKGKQMPHNQTFNPREVKYIRMGMSGIFLVESKYAEYITRLKEWYDSGILTDITFLIFGKWNSKTKERFRGILKDNGNEWAWNHSVFATRDELEVSFLLRRIRCYKISHYVDINKDHLTPIVKSNLYHTTKMFRWHDDIKHGWEEFRAWIRRYNPTHFNLCDQGIGADLIIQTGVMAKLEEEEVYTSDGYQWFEGM